MKLFLTVISFLITITSPITANGCIGVERDALLTFKAGFEDPGNLLSSWQGPDCCNWTGVNCDDITERVVILNLRNPYDRYDDYSDWESHAFTGEINPILLSLRHLTHLDISGHYFSNLSIPKFIGSFEYLIYLNLSFSWFQGVIPCELGNLSRLQFLDLDDSMFTGLLPPQLGNLSNLRHLSLYNPNQIDPSFKSPSNRVSWISRLSHLRYLDMSGFYLNSKVDWPAINQLQQLETLYLYGCYLSEIPTDLSQVVNLTSLTTLDLSYNSFNVTLPNWLWNLTNLLYLDLSWSKFHGNITDTLSNLASLNYLSLGGNNFEHVFLKPIGKLLSLRTLDMSWLGIGGNVDNFIKLLDDIWYNLEVLHLPSNDLSGNISWIARMRNLFLIDLSDNSLSGHIPMEIGTLSYLKELYLRNNSLFGDITDAHFVNLSNLETLDLSDNILSLKINNKWVPPFQLRDLYLYSCKVGPRFPSWLRWQTKLNGVGLSNTSITGFIPTWFWNMSFLISVDLAYNNITGNLPTTFQLSKIQYLNLRSNSISGPIPIAWGEITTLDLSNNNISGSFPTKLGSPQAYYIALARNRIHGSIPHSICNMSNLVFLDLSNNNISEDIPNCWKTISNLQYIDLSNNQIIGELPTSLGSLQYLVTLQLYNNKLYGEVPSTLQQCRSLVFLSLGVNNFSGTIPAWIGKHLQNLVVLQLRSNKFIGGIPSELGELAKLQVLDLAHNSLVGSIPTSIGNFSSMKNSSQYYITVVKYHRDVGDYMVYENQETLYIDINGQYSYTSKPLEYVKTIDISGNNLNGHIPKEIWSLQAVLNLNLSKNCLIGEIPETIGGMRSLESLDLSFNEFSGPIPQAISTLSSLHNLNLSYNNFSAKIPNGRQLDTLSDPSIYIGNSYLCGPPTNKNCFEDESSIGTESVHGDNGREMVGFCLCVAIGYILGFWSVCVILIFRKIWRVVYFRRIDKLFDIIYVQIVLVMRRLVGDHA